MIFDRAIQPGLQFFVTEGLDDLLVQAGHPGQRDVLTHRAFGDLRRAADLVVAQPACRCRRNVSRICRIVTLLVDIGSNRKKR